MTKTKGFAGFWPKYRLKFFTAGGVALALILIEKKDPQNPFMIYPALVPFVLLFVSALLELIYALKFKIAFNIKNWSGFNTPVEKSTNPSLYSENLSIIIVFLIIFLLCTSALTLMLPPIIGE